MVGPMMAGHVRCELACVPMCHMETNAQAFLSGCPDVAQKGEGNHLEGKRDRQELKVEKRE